MTIENIKKMQIIITLDDGRSAIGIVDDVFTQFSIVRTTKFAIIKENLMEEISLGDIVDKQFKVSKL